MYKLVERSDVFLTTPSRSFEPARLWHRRPEGPQPTIIYARGHGFGMRGPEANTPS